ncbi:MAG TPA: hypothetical protein VG938_18885, partial [Verrucomicrobiae bacterium]|nr:hypothetical protein [Verrucomicrobiae bacterium]
MKVCFSNPVVRHSKANPFNFAMKKANSISLLAVAALNFCFLLPEAHAAVRTWSGAGADANWSTAGNWGGTAPVNADVLLFSGVTQQNNNNDIA